MDDIANHCPAKNALCCRILHVQTQKIFGVGPNTLDQAVGGDDPSCTHPSTEKVRERRPPVFGSPAFPLLPFYEMTTVVDI